MKTKLIINKLKRPFGWSCGVAIIVYCSVTILLYFLNETLENQYSRIQPQIISAPDSKWDKDQYNFWKNYMEQDVKAAMSGRFGYDEVRGRYDLLTREIAKRYERSYALYVSPSVLRRERDSTAGSYVQNGQPTVCLYVPTLMEFRKTILIKNPLTGDVAFKNELVIFIMHELEHLAFDIAPGGTPLAPMLEDEDEARAWASTYRYVIAPLIEKYHQPFPSRELEWYLVWHSDPTAGPDDYTWRTFVRNIYGHAYYKHDSSGQ